VSLGSLRLLFLVYVLALCALAISDPSFERGGALFVLTLGIVGVMWQMDLGIVPVILADDAGAEGDDNAVDNDALP
jgi:hypothetical protein